MQNQSDRTGLALLRVTARKIEERGVTRALRL
jgi:hypothetical protein